MIFLCNWGYICGHQLQRHDWLVKLPCNAFHENYGTGGKLGLQIQVGKLNFTLELIICGFVTLRDNPGLDKVKCSCTILIFINPQRNIWIKIID